MSGISAVECGSITNNNINSYNTCIDDHSPLLSQPRHVKIHEKLFVTILSLILVTGVIIGTHLLLSEGHERRIPTIYNLTSRNLWQADPPAFPMSALTLPTRSVLLLSTNSSTCRGKSQCGQVLRKLQREHMFERQPDISYNFVVTDDGDIFEGRGWSFQSTFPDYSPSDAVTIAFLGRFTSEQADSARLFIDVSVMEGKLERCFNVSVWGGNPLLWDTARNIQSGLSSCEEIT